MGNPLITHILVLMIKDSFIFPIDFYTVHQKSNDNPKTLSQIIYFNVHVCQNVKQSISVVIST